MPNFTDAVAEPDRCSVELAGTGKLCELRPIVHMVLSLVDPREPDRRATAHCCGAHAAWLRASGVVDLEHPWRRGGMPCGLPDAVWNTDANRCEMDDDGGPDELTAELARFESAATESLKMREAVAS